MADLPNTPSHPPARSLPEALIRTLRHEIGDLLQKVYASVAILKDRLPADKDMERGVLTRLWSRAETCRRFIDATHDFVCRISLDYQPLDLAQVAAAAAAVVQPRFAHVKIVVENAGPAPALADARRAAQVAELLLTNACEAARARVGIRTSVDPAAGEVQWAVSDDGPGIKPELAGDLFSPFFTTRAGHCGLGLALGRKLVELHGGRISAGNAPAEGFLAQVFLPVEPPSPDTVGTWTGPGPE
jgi:signal transduction histidine kinase